MAQAFVQRAANTAGASGTTVAQAYSSGNTGGNCLIAVVNWVETSISGPFSTVTVADTANGSSYTSAALSNNKIGGFSNWSEQAFILTGCNSGANTVTATFSTTVNFPKIIVLEYSGVSGAGTASVVSTTVANDSTTPSTGNLTVGSGQGIFASVITPGGDVTTAGTNYTLREDFGSGGVQDWLNATTGSQSIGMNLNVASAYGFIAFLMLGAGAGGSQISWVNRHRKFVNK